MDSRWNCISNLATLPVACGLGIESSLRASPLYVATFKENSTLWDLKSWPSTLTRTCFDDGVGCHTASPCKEGMVWWKEGVSCRIHSHLMVEGEVAIWFNHVQGMDPTSLPVATTCRAIASANSFHGSPRCALTSCTSTPLGLDSPNTWITLARVLSWRVVLWIFRNCWLRAKSGLMRTWASPDAKMQMLLQQPLLKVRHRC